MAGKLPLEAALVIEPTKMRLTNISGNLPLLLLLFFAAMAPVLFGQDGGSAEQDVVRGKVANPHGSLNITCENCHTTSAWRPIRRQPEFNHNTQTSFALLGLHQNVSCTECHVNLVFAKAPTRCSECHADLHRRQFGPNCQDCHSPKGWNVEISAIKDHNNRFPLIGAHAVAVCEDCHKGAAAGVYVGLSTQCVSCHLKDYQTGTPLNHVAANLPTTCETCHSMTVWQNAKFNHNQFTNFALTGAHATVACVQCHVGNRFAGTPTDCYTCHINDFQTANSPNHVLAAFSQNCTLCHTTLSWTGANFDHSTTGFTLTGGHVALQCQQCHNSQFGNYSIPNGGCWNCHQADYKGTTDPPHVSGGLPQDCSQCHTTVPGWGGATFNHTTTGFTLTGAHTSLQCTQCHNSQFGNYTISNGACGQCHMADYNGTNNPNHAQAAFPTTCDTCHTTVAGWGGATFNHTTTGFTLTGGHTTLQCQQCHNSQFGNYSISSGACAQCHMVDFNGANNPSHTQAGFPTTCDTCHTTAPGWGGASFNHSSTGFTLTGAHTSLQCQQCHNTQFGNYSISSGQCWNCHQNDYNTANSPNHKQANFPQDCTSCHTTTNWTGATFNHSSTGFTLTGAHTALQCVQCHNAQFGNYSISSPACGQCHMTDFNGTTNPNHVQAGFPTTCDTCHTTVAGWGGATFNHATTGFALTGTHTSLQCQQCHNSQFGNYSIANGSCWNCHQTDYNGTNNPSHLATNFPQDCSGCHTTVNWLGAVFNHTSTGFALVGTHSTLQCTQCHTSTVGYTISSGACWNCHQADYQGANNPPHASSGFPQDCTVCHGTAITNWTSATFNHTTTGFALTGAHTSLQCAQCHTATLGYNISAAQAVCWTCHQTDYNGTTNPPHKATNFPQDCSGCHTTVDWTGAVFNHTSTGFALVGLHASQQCSACHTATLGYNITAAQAVCWTCHQTDYNGATNPPHAASNFPQDCTVCHGTSITNWTSATFNHTTTGFTLTGAHTSLQCSQCHNATFGNYNITSGACWNCHQTDYNGTTNPPHATNNFPQDCSQCHTTALGWGGATFNHATQENFALTGAHATLACTACHNSTFGNYSITSTACVNCHLKDYQGTTSPNHAAANFPQTCDSCHTTVAGWGGATFTHPSTPLALTGYHATMLANNQCSQCHTATAGYNITSGACINCHQADYNGATNPPHAAQGFPTTCDSCHTFTDWTGAVFNHSSTGFTLTGAHTTQACTACHTATLGYNITPAQAVCWTCHQTEYNSTTAPPHASAGFPQDCSQCHTTNATTPPWAGATFTHPTTPLALTGYHATMLTNSQCSSCHLGTSPYTNTPSDCWSCHQTDYNNTTNPSHKTIGTTLFPQTCNTCHTFTDWTGAKFTAHDTDPGTGPFPIYSGTHNGRWQNCTDCHPSADYTKNTVTCMTGSCHPASQVDNVGAHKTALANGTLHLGSTCIGCHRTGSGG